MDADRYQLGFRDGAQAARESGTSQPPADGWDGWLVNSIGGEATAQLLAAPTEGPEWESALAEYAAGAQAGAEAEAEAV